MSRASPWPLVFLLAACAHGGGEPAQVTIPQLPIPQRTEDLPATVTVAAGQERRLDIQIDTGLRDR